MKRTKLPHGHSERGFTIIEVMVAVFVLLLGVLGVATMMDTANAITDNTKAREGASALSRQLLEDARTVPYAELDSTSNGVNQLQTDLQNLGVADADGNPANGWQVVRRNITFNVTVYACIFDDKSDGARVQGTSGEWCPGSATPVASGTPTGPNGLDKNPDDFRRVEVDVTWSFNGKTPSCRDQTTAGGGLGVVATNNSGQFCVQQSELIPNPSGGLGPGISNITPIYTGADGAGNTHDSVLASSGVDKGAIEDDAAQDVSTNMGFNVTTSSPADQVVWSSDDGSSGTATQTDSAGVKWSFTWNYPTSPPLPDGPHVVTIQAFLLSLAGRPKTFTQDFNRFIPAGPSTNITDSAGNPIPAAGVDTRNGRIVELNWNEGSDNDLAGYAAFLEPPGATAPGLNNGNNNASSDSIACPFNANTTQLNCYDPNPPSSGVRNYYILPFDTPWTNLVPLMLNPPVYSNSCGGVSGACWTCPSLNGNTNLNVSLPIVTTVRPGCPSQNISVDITAGIANQGPTWPSGACFNVSTNAAGLPQLDWSSFPASDSDGVIFYRIYRDPGSLSNPAYTERYSRTSSTIFIDPAPGTGPHTYAVTAVDSKYQESAATIQSC